MTYSHELVERWRYQAQSARTPVEGGTLLRCSNELERYHHDATHDGERVTGCPHCLKEWEQENNVGS